MQSFSIMLNIFMYDIVNKLCLYIPLYPDMELLNKHIRCVCVCLHSFDLTRLSYVIYQFNVMVKPVTLYTEFLQQNYM